MTAATSTRPITQEQSIGNNELRPRKRTARHNTKRKLRDGKAPPNTSRSQKSITQSQSKSSTSRAAKTAQPIHTCLFLQKALQGYSITIRPLVFHQARSGWFVHPPRKRRSHQTRKQRRQDAAENATITPVIQCTSPRSPSPTARFSDPETHISRGFSSSGPAVAGHPKRNLFPTEPCWRAHEQTRRQRQSSVPRPTLSIVGAQASSQKNQTHNTPLNSREFICRSARQLSHCLFAVLCVSNALASSAASSFVLTCTIHVSNPEPAASTVVSLTYFSSAR